LALKKINDLLFLADGEGVFLKRKFGCMALFPRGKQL